MKILITTISSVLLLVGCETPAQQSFSSRHSGILTDHNGKLRFPIGFYEFPGNKEQLQRMAESGINLVRCGNRASLDSAHEQGMMGWVPLSVQQGATPGLRKQIETLRNHPALAVWEGPDEIVWTFTAYSFLKERAGFTREDWNNQIPVSYTHLTLPTKA